MEKKNMNVQEIALQMGVSLPKAYKLKRKEH